VRPTVVRAAAALSAAAALGFGYLLYEAQWLRRTAVELPVAGLPPALDGLVVVQLSDMHAGFRASLNMRATHKALALARTAGADLVVITGDLVSGPRGVPRVLAALTGVTAPLGVYAVLGNHDHGISKTPGVQSSDLTGLAGVGIQLLANECVTVEGAAAASAASSAAAAPPAAVQVCGLDEWKHGFADAAQVAAALDRRPGTLRLLLSHYAEGALEFAPGDFAVAFSGDTHGGQICLPWFGGRIMLSQPRARFKDGLYEIGGRRICVTRGIGTSFLPFRFLCRPEVVIVRLVSN
jgi:uncharacterized protein